MNENSLTEGVTVIICTYNGALRISETLKHLAQQQFPIPISWEVIVVDNASVDETTQVVNETWHSLNTNVKFNILLEKNPGKINALQRGVSAACHSYFIICDDDNRLASDYVYRMYQILQSNNKIGAAGGSSIAVTDDKLPGWFEEYSTHYAIGRQALDSGDITSRGYLWGAGTGSRTAVFREWYPRFPSLLTGRREGKLLAGEDAEYCSRLILKGYSLYYDDKLFFKHYIPAYRLTTTYRDGVLEGINQSMKVIDKYFLAEHMRSKLRRNEFNRLRLLALTPFRIHLSGTKQKKEREKNKLQFLLPFSKVTDPDIKLIRQFLSWL